MAHTDTQNVLGEVERYCTEHRLFAEEKVLVALSGGGDSVALVNILGQLQDNFGITLIAAHINHGLRGEYADRDEEFCHTFCDTRNIPLIVEHIPPGELASQKESIETAARDARQQLLKKIARKEGATKIATGHTLSDQAETILHRIIRGTGPAGLSGILPIRDNTWIRPLLCLGRDTIRQYLDACSISFCEDETNENPSFTRNRIRNILIPLIKKEFSSASEYALARLAEINRQQEDWIRSQIDDAFSSTILYTGGDKILLDKQVFLGYHTTIQQRLIRYCRTLLEGPGFDDDAATTELIRSLIGDDGGKLIVNANLICEVYENNIVFTGNTEQYGPCPINIPGTTELPNGNGTFVVSYESKPQDTQLPSVTIPVRLIREFGQLNAGPVREGETMKLSNRRSPIKIRDLYSAARLPTVLRTVFPVIRVGAVALWIPAIANAGEISREPGLAPDDDGSITIAYQDGIVWQK